MKLNKIQKRTAFFLRVFLGLVFLYAAWDKILHPKEFAESIYNYQILPDMLINISALILPWLELILGIMVIIGIWLPGSLFLINLLMLIFTSALIFNLARGLNIECGCFGSGADLTEFSTTRYILRDIIFLLCGLYALYYTYAEEKMPKTGIFQSRI